MMLKTDYTHYGWFGICPIYLAKPFTECPVVAPRAEWAVPLFVVSQYAIAAWIYVRTLLDPEWVPYWPISVTGEIE